MQKRSLALAGDWDDLRYFLAIARSGRFTIAAKTLRTAETTVGRRVRALEERVGTKLLDRGLNGMRLTPAGASAMEEIEMMEQAALRAERTLFGSDEKLEGPVRVTSTEGIASYWLTPRLVAFRKQYPGIRVEIITSDDVLDLGRREADIAIRYARPIDPNLVGVKVGRLNFDLVCAKDYAARHSLPNSFDGLRRFALIDHEPNHTIPAWRALLNMDPLVAYRSNSSIGVLQAINSGMGIGLIARFARSIFSDLMALDLSLDCALDVWLISHIDTNKAARVQAMWNFLKDQFQRDRSAWFT
jgi:DNA-binding transcriptional LysR family regulator